MQRLPASFYRRDVLEVAPELPGKYLVFNQTPYLITEVEAYRGEEDLACHASKGRTARTEIMYHQGGYIYVYLIYGMYWMLNFVTGEANNPQAVLIRGIVGYNGPGKLTRYLQIDKSFYGESLLQSDRVWVAQSDRNSSSIITTPRIGINYAGKPWTDLPWRFLLDNQ